jgi:hypothetical protein
MAGHRDGVRVGKGLLFVEDGNEAYGLPRVKAAHSIVGSTFYINMVAVGSPNPSPANRRSAALDRDAATSRHRPNGSPRLGTCDRAEAKNPPIPGSRRCGTRPPC